MKRRSARPFTVEIKHTRTSRVSLTDATSRIRTGQDLWRGLPIAETDKPADVQSAPDAHVEPAQGETTVRRVLPSLVPMFSMSVEPEAVEVRARLAVERLPRVRRPKHKQPAVKAIAGPPAAKPTVQPQVTPAIRTSSTTKAPTDASRAASLQSRPARRTPQAVILRPGERWKRRLPRVLW